MSLTAGTQATIGTAALGMLATIVIISAAVATKETSSVTARHQK
jgi:hypothetical protein